MRGVVLCIALLCALGAAGAVHAAEPGFQVALAEERVDITTGFNGTSVTLFGTTGASDRNIVVTLSGPETTAVIRRKARALGLWVNADSLEFRRVPSYYDYAESFSDAGLKNDAKLMEDNRIGIDNLAFYAENADEDPETEGVFRDALTRRMQEKGLYPLRPETVDFLGPGFFKVSFNLPPGVPTGLYTVEAMQLHADGTILRETRMIRIGQVGFNAEIYLLAENHALTYGVAAVLIALLTGWAAFTFLRRD